MGRRWHWAWGLAALLAIASCNSPTLPLPPPAAPEEVVLSDDGTRVELAGTGAIPGALVLVFNEQPSVLSGAIVTADASGRYRLTAAVDLSVSSVNEFDIWQRVGTDDSSLITFLVRARTLGTPDAGPPDARAEAGSEAEPSEAAPSDGNTGDRADTLPDASTGTDSDTNP
jgi:hypothetical protein